MSAAAAQNVGLPIRGEIGQSVVLDPTDGFVAQDGTALRAEWAWEDRPAVSVAEFSDTTALRPTVTVDVAGTYVARLNLFAQADPAATDPLYTTTVEISTENLTPVAQIVGRSTAGFDAPFTLDGSDSYDVDGDALTYLWSVDDQPAAGSVVFADLTAALTDVTFADLGQYTLALTVQDSTGRVSAPAFYELELSGDDTAALGLAATLGTFNLVTNSLESRQTVQGRSYIGDTLTQVSGQFATNLPNDGADFAGLSVDGDIRDSNINLGNGTTALISGVRFQSNVNNGTLIEGATDLPVFDFDQFKADSAFLASLTGDALDLSDQNHKRFGGAANADLSEAQFGANTRIVHTSLQDLQTGGYSVDVSGVDTVVVNVSGTSGRFQMNPLGGTAAAPKVIWNFYEATSLDINAVIMGHILAPYATLNGFSGGSEGTVIADAVKLTNGPLRQRSWDGEIPLSDTAATDTRNVAPTAALFFDQTIGGAPVAVSAQGSTDLDADALSAGFDVIFGAAASAADAQAVLSLDATGQASDILVAANVTDGTTAAADQILVAAAGGSVRPMAVINAGALDAGVLPLDGTQSYDLNGDLLTYEWSLLSAPQGSLAGLNAATPTTSLTVDMAGIYIAQLVVHDGVQSSVPQTVVINTDAALPVADAGPDGLADAAGLALLDGALSTGSALEFAWSPTAITGSAGTLATPEQVTTQIALTDDGAGGFAPSVTQFVVTNVNGISRPDTVLTGTGNIRPTLSQGAPVVANGGAAIILTAADYAFDANADTLTYGWSLASRPDGSEAVIDPANPTAQIVPGATLDFTPDQVGTYLIQLTTSDGVLAARPAVITVTVENTAPTAVIAALPDTNVGTAVTLDGTGSFDPESNVLSYQWSVISRPAGSTAAIADATLALTSFVPDVKGTYAFALVVADFGLSSSPATASLNVPNQAPQLVIDAPTTVAVGETAVFDASGSFDPDGDVLSYAITVTSATGGTASVDELPGGIFGVTPDQAGDYTVVVSVSDGDVTETSATTLTATLSNGAPVLGDLRDTYTVELGLEFALDLTAIDPDGDATTFYANPLPLATGINLDGTTGAVRFRPESGQIGTYILTLGVSDGALTDETVITIEVVPGTASDTSVFGRVLDANDFANGVETALANMPVRLERAALQTVTDANGLFDFGSLTAGPDVVRIDPDAVGGPGGYLALERPITATANQDRDLSPAFLLTPLNEGCAPVIPGQDTVLTGALTGVEVTILADTILATDGSTFAGQVCLGSLPQQTPVAGFPADTLACQVYGLSAPGANFSAGVSIAAPNYDNLPETTQLTLWQQSESNKNFGLASQEPVLPVSATVSSRLAGFGDEPEAVYDGDRLTYVHTLNGANEFIEIDFGEDIPLAEVGTRNRSTGSDEAARLNGATMVVYDSAQNEVFRSEPIAGAISNEVFSYNFDRPIVGRYVAVEHNNQWLHVSEINAARYIPPAATNLTVRAPSFRRITSAFVDPGAVTVQSTNANIRPNTLFAFLPQAPKTVASADMPTGNRQLSVFEGDLNEVYTLPGYFAFNQQQQVGLSYHSAAADPTVIVAGDVTIADDMSLPVTMSTRIEVGGLSIASDVDWTPRQGADGSTPALVGEAVNLRQSMPVDATGLLSGRYPYRFFAKASYDCSTVSAEHQAELYVQNQTDSPYGTGWSIDGLQTLTQNPDGSVAIIDDDGITTFDPKPTFTEFDEDPIVFPNEGTIRVVTGDFDGNGLTDVAFGEAGFGRANVALNFGDRQFEIVNGDQVTAPDVIPETGDNFPPFINLRKMDYNQDGVPDLLVIDQDIDNLIPLVNDGNARFTPDATIPSSNSVVSIADFDNDGFTDFIVPSGFFFNGSGLLRPGYYYGNGTDYDFIRTGSFSGFSFGGGPPLQSISADMDNDGFTDIVYRGTSGIAIGYISGTRGRMGFTNFRLGSSPARQAGSYSAIGDLNGDGFKDIVISDDDILELFLNVGPRAYSDAIEIVRPVGADDAGPVNLIDLDGDGNLDLLYSGLSDTAAGELAIYRGIGDGTFEPPQFGQITHPIGDTAIADLDGDGSLDLISTQRFSVTIDFSDPSASGEFVGGAGEFSTLTKLADGTFERRYKDGMVVVFDANGLQTAEVDPQGNRREFAYADGGRLASITDQVGGQTIFTYDSFGRLASTTYPDGRTTGFTYDDSDGALLEVTEPTGSKVSFEYNDDGQLVSTTNQNGNSTAYTYDSVGKFSTATLPDGSNIAASVAASLGLADGLGNSGPVFFVAPEDRVTTVTDRKGEVTEVIVNEFGSPIQITDPLGRVTRMERDTRNLVLRVERPSDATADGVRVDEIEYDNNANVTRMAEAVGTPQERETLYSYEPEFNQVTSMTDADGFTTAYEYDAFGEVTKTTDPEGGERLMGYNAEGQITSRTDENGNATSYIYNSTGNLGQMTYADGSISTMIYDGTGNTTAMNEAVGTTIERQVQRTYDALNRVLTEIDALGNTTSFEYDAIGNKVRFEDQVGRAAIAAFDEMNRPIGGQDPMTGTSTVAYALGEREITSTDAEGRIDAIEFDDIGRLSRKIEPNGTVRSQEYNEANLLSAMVDAVGGVSTVEYDGLDRSIRSVNPSGEAIRLFYDRRDNVVRSVAPDGETVDFVYDGLGRITTMMTPDNVYSYTYDAVSNLQSVSDNDSTISYTYDERNRPVIETFNYPNIAGIITLTHEYDILGRRTRTIDSYGGVVVHSYDAENRQVRIDQPWGASIDFTFDADGRPRGKQYEDGTLTEVAYDNGGRPSDMTHAFGDTPFFDESFGYDRSGRIIEIRDNVSIEETRTLFHDTARRLIGVYTGVPEAEGGIQIPTEDYAYDLEDNRIASHLTSSYVYDADHRLLENADYVYTYDLDGNRSSRTDKRTGESTVYDWDAQDQLIRVSSSLGWSTSFLYDAMQRRIGKVYTAIDGTVTETAFVYDGPNVIFVFTTTDGITRSRRWTNAHGLDKRYSFEDYQSADPTPGSGTVYEVHQDYRGSIIAVVDPASGTIVSRYRYDSFGRRTVVIEQVDTGYGYTGHQFDTETGLGYFRARYFDPEEGRFLSVDPLGFPDGPMNSYVYVANTPYQSVDPLGLSAASAGLGVITANTKDMGRENAPLIYGAVTNLLLRTLNAAFDQLYFPDSGNAGLNPNLAAVQDANRASGCRPTGPRPVRQYLPVNTRTHGGAAHDRAIKARYNFLRFLNARALRNGQVPRYTRMQMNQQQSTAGGQAVSTCRPDLQYNHVFIARYLEEYMMSSDALQTFNKMLVMNRADPLAAQVMVRVGGGRR